jgi:hypothetical protein
MKARAVLHTSNTPTPQDPLGSDPSGDGIPGSVPAFIVDIRPDGFVVEALDGAEVRDGVEEGTQPGQVSTVSGLSFADEQTAKERFASAVSSGGPQTQLAARAVRAGLTGAGRAQTVGDLLAAIANPPSDSIGALAVLALGFVLSEARE